MPDDISNNYDTSYMLVLYNFLLMEATSRTGGSPVNLGVNGAARVGVNSSEDHGVNNADNSHLNPLEDTINNASMAQRDSSENA